MTGVYTDRNKPFWQPALRIASKLCVSCLPPEMVSQRMTQREDERNDFVCHTFGWACLSCDLGPLQLIAARIRLSYWVRMNEKTQTQQQGIRLGHAVEPEPIVKHRFRKNLLQKLCLPLWSSLLPHTRKGRRSKESRRWRRTVRDPHIVREPVFMPGQRRG